MKNRKLPFGYQMERGKAVIHPKEAEIVMVVFRQYVSGSSYLEVVQMLKTQPVPYDTGRLWNKNMVARILEDSRYLGQTEYPAIIDEDLFQQAVQKRCTKQVTQLTSSQKLLRRLTGHKASGRIEQQVLHLLNDLAKKPEMIQQQPIISGTQEKITLLETELEKLLDTQPIDEDAAQQCIRQIAAAQYESIPDTEYETQRLRHIFTQAGPMEELDAELLKNTVSQIKIDGAGTVSIYLKNDQIIGRSNLP